MSLSLAEVISPSVAVRAEVDTYSACTTSPTNSRASAIVSSAYCFRNAAYSASTRQRVTPYLGEDDAR